MKIIIIVLFVFVFLLVGCESAPKDKIIITDEGTFRISYEKETCPTCKGTCHLNNETCLYCKGQGRIVGPCNACGGQKLVRYGNGIITCPNCSGSGILLYPCNNCAGTGKPICKECNRQGWKYKEKKEKL